MASCNESWEMIDCRISVGLVLCEGNRQRYAIAMSSALEKDSELAGLSTWSSCHDDSELVLISHSFVMLSLPKKFSQPRLHHTPFIFTCSNHDRPQLQYFTESLACRAVWELPVASCDRLTPCHEVSKAHEWGAGGHWRCCRRCHPCQDHELDECCRRRCAANFSGLGSPWVKTSP